MVDKAAKKRVQGGIDRSRKAARRDREAAAKATGAEREDLLKSAAAYDREVAHLLRTCSDLGVR